MAAFLAELISFVTGLAGLVLLVWLLWWLASLPGRLAASNGHPWPQAVRVAGWLGMLLGGLLWPLALIWAFLPVPQPR